jgi:hypothetical protein
VGDDPLVVPAHQATRLLEGVGGSPLAQLVHHAVVELQESKVHLGDDQVCVVARIADRSPALRVAGQIMRLPCRVHAEQQLVGVLHVVKERQA